MGSHIYYLIVGIHYGYPYYSNAHINNARSTNCSIKPLYRLLTCIVSQSKQFFLKKNQYGVKVILEVVVNRRIVFVYKLSSFKESWKIRKIIKFYLPLHMWCSSIRQITAQWFYISHLSQSICGKRHCRQFERKVWRYQRGYLNP